MAKDLQNSSFIRLYQDHLNAVYRYHLAHTGNVQDAQDLTSESFRAALEGFDAYRAELGSPLAWLMGIARHKLYDYLRRSHPASRLEEVDQQPDPVSSPEEVVLHGLEMGRLSQALAHISADRREALALHFIAGLTLAETAQVMHRGEDAVKKLVQRGLENLRKELNPQKESQL